jgi:hypothetical protein
MRYSTHHRFVWTRSETVNHTKMCSDLLSNVKFLILYHDFFLLLSVGFIVY